MRNLLFYFLFILPGFLCAQNCDRKVPYEGKPGYANYPKGYFCLTGGKWGTVDAYNKQIIPPQYDSIFTTNSLATPFFVRQNNKYGSISGTGQVLIPVQYDSLCEDGLLFFLAKKGDYWGILK